MGKPKKRTTPRQTGNRRSHLVRKLADVVNALSPVNVIISKKKRAKANAKKQATPKK